MHATMESFMFERCKHDEERVRWSVAYEGQQKHSPAQKVPAPEKIKERPLTVVEKSYMRVVDDILSQCEWWRKVENEQFRATWEDEAARNGISPKGIDFMWKELAHIRDERSHPFEEDRDGGIWPMTTVGVYVADNIVPDDVIAQFRSQIQGKAPSEPNLTGARIDVVDPSRRCAVFGHYRSYWGMHRFLTPTQGQFQVRGLSSEDKFFQLLPSVVHVRDDKVKLASYIMDLDSKQNSGTYESIEHILQGMIPLLELAVSAKPTCVLRVPGFTVHELTKLIDDEWTFLDGRSKQERKKWLHKIGVPDCRIGDEEYELQRIVAHLRPPGHLWGFMCDPVTKPNPTEFQAFERYLFGGGNTVEGPVIRLRGRDLRVIVRVSTILLTPETPTFAGEDWSRDLWEVWQIAACGFFFYDVENVDNPRIEFSRPVNPFYVEGWFSEEVQQAYGISKLELNADSGMYWQGTGHTAVPSAGRCVVAQRDARHRLAPFSLADPSQCGCVKMLVFYVVDPVQEILSTKSVPIEQS